MTTKLKAKGLLKGLQYISQMFDNEKEKEFQIGHPTDVKHVAHIGWDGPSAANSAPSWLNDFQASGAGVFSAPLGNGPVGTNETVPVKWPSEDLTRKGGSEQLCSSPTRELPVIPRSSRRQPAANTSSEESPKVKSKSKQPKKSSKGSQSTSSQATDPAFQSSSPARPDIPRKTRRKKPKEPTVGGSTRSRLKEDSSLTYEAPFSDPGLGSGALAMPKYSDEFGQVSRFETFDKRKENSVSSMS